MTRLAQRRLRLLQQALAEPALFRTHLRHLEELRERGGGRPGRLRCVRSHRFDEVRRMTRLTRDGGRGVRRVAEILLLARRDVAREAPRAVLLHRPAKREDQLVGRGRQGIVAARRFHAVGVRLSRTVTRLAVHALPAFRNDVSVGRLVELRQFRPVARAAAIFAGEPLVGGLRSEPHADHRTGGGRRPALRAG